MSKVCFSSILYDARKSSKALYNKMLGWKARKSHALRVQFAACIWRRCSAAVLQTGTCSVEMCSCQSTTMTSVGCSRSRPRTSSERLDQRSRSSSRGTDTTVITVKVWILAVSLVTDEARRVVTQNSIVWIHWVVADLTLNPDLSYPVNTQLHSSEAVIKDKHVSRIVFITVLSECIITIRLLSVKSCCLDLSILSVS